MDSADIQRLLANAKKEKELELLVEAAQNELSSIRAKKKKSGKSKKRRGDVFDAADFFDASAQVHDE